MFSKISWYCFLDANCFFSANIGWQQYFSLGQMSGTVMNSFFVLAKSARNKKKIREM
jgi:hypothetical protein